MVKLAAIYFANNLDLPANGVMNLLMVPMGSGDSDKLWCVFSSHCQIQPEPQDTLQNTASYPRHWMAYSNLNNR